MFSSRFFRARFTTARFWRQIAPAAPTFNPLWATDTDQSDQPVLPSRI